MTFLIGIQLLFTISVACLNKDKKKLKVEHIKPFTTRVIHMN